MCVFIRRFNHIIKLQHWPATQSSPRGLSHLRLCSLFLLSLPSFPAQLFYSLDFLFNPCGHPSENGLHWCYFKKKKKNKLKVWGNPASSKSVGAVIPTSSLHSLSHFGDSHSISNCYVCHKSLMDEGLLLTDEQRKWFFERESVPDGDAVKKGQ